MQLDCGIRLLFSGSEHVAAHTLIGAASVLYGNLVSVMAPSKSWDTFAQDANGLNQKQYYEVIRATQNFLKHADRDPDDQISFDPNDTDALAFGAVWNAGALGPMSLPMQVFHLWYWASHSHLPDTDAHPVYYAFDLFGDLRGLSRVEQIGIGRMVLEAELKQTGGR